MFCHACGTENDDGSRFCRSCGTPQIAAAPAPEPEPVPEPDPEPVIAPPPVSAEATKVCPTCRSEFPPALKFCERDGTALVALAVPAAAPEPATPAPAVPMPEPEPAAAAPAIASQATQYCESCGSPLAPDDVFCSECGARSEPLAQAPDASPPAPVAEAPAAPDLPPVAPVAAVELPAEPEAVPAVDEPAIDAATQDAGAASPEGDEAHDTGDIEEALPWLAPASAVEADDEAAPDTVVEDAARDDDWSEPEAEGRSRMLVWSLAGLVLLGVAGGAGYIWRDRLTALAGLDQGAAVTAEADAAQSGVPRVAGTYTAFLMDQEIEISFEGDPAVLAEAKGTARYFNTVNGGRCVSRLVAIQSGGIGGEPSGKVLFSQQPKDGEPPCGKDIPMLIDIDKQAMGENGLVSRLAIEWQSPETKEVLMSGDLVLTNTAD